MSFGFTKETLLGQDVDQAENAAHGQTQDSPDLPVKVGTGELGVNCIDLVHRILETARIFNDILSHVSLQEEEDDSTMVTAGTLTTFLLSGI